MKNLSNGILIAWAIAVEEARSLDYNRIDIPHFFLAFLDLVTIPEDDIPHITKDEKAGEAFAEIKSFRKFILDNIYDPSEIVLKIREMIGKGVGAPKLGYIHRSNDSRILFNRAFEISNIYRGYNINVFHLLMAILQNEAISSYISTKLNINLEKIGSNLHKVLSSENIYKQTLEKPDYESREKEKEEYTESADRKETKTPLLDKLGRDLTELARMGKLPKVIGRKETMRQIGRILSQKIKNNVLLIGEPGVGKTSIIEGFAQKIADKSVVQILQNIRIVELNLSVLVAGTKYRGDFEKRLEEIIKEASNNKDIVLFIDEFHIVVGLGRSGSDVMDGANILKPALSKGEFRCIGATTVDEYRQYIEKDSALERRFQVVWVEEPNLDETLEILKGIVPTLEQHYHVQIDREILALAVNLSIQYIPFRRLPDKAIDILDRACSRKILKTISISTTDSKSIKTQPTVIIEEDVRIIVEEMSKVPVLIPDEDERSKFIKIEDRFKERVFGQDEAINTICKALRVAKAGLKSQNKPKGVFLFLGTTGVGKTETAKTLAEILFGDDKQIIRLDMSEYSQEHTVARLIGSPPGYIGYGEGGQLTNKVRNNPYSVILFDEVEKAHDSVFDIFLQIFDNGQLTDGQGKTADFSNSLIIMTSNLGSREAIVPPEVTIGFSIDEEYKESFDKEHYKRIINEAVKARFRPEFINRIDRLVIFYPLTVKNAKQIVMKAIDKLARRIEQRGFNLKVTDGAINILLKEGFSFEYGAREINRLVEIMLVEPLGEFILSQEIPKDSIVEVGAMGGKLNFKIIK